MRICDKIIVPTLHFGPQTLAVVHEYRHLGSWDEASESMKKEVMCRCAATNGAELSLRKQVLANMAYSSLSRTKIVTSISLSHLQYNVHTWPPLNAKLSGIMTHRCMHTWRTIR